MCRLKTFLLLQKNSEDVGKDTVLRGSAMNAMERVKTKQAAAELNIGVDSLQFLMQMEKMPIGYAYKKPGCKRYSYIIYRGLLDQYKMQLAAGTARIGI